MISRHARKPADPGRGGRPWCGPILIVGLLWVGLLVPVVGSTPDMAWAADRVTLTGTVKYYPGTPNSDDYPHYFVDGSHGQRELSLCGQPMPKPGCGPATQVVNAVGRQVTITGRIIPLPGGELLFPDTKVLEVETLTVSGGGIQSRQPSAAGPDPDMAGAFLNQARDAYHRKNFGQAVELATKAIQANPGAAPAYFLRGDAYDELGKFDQAIKDFDAATERDPNFVDAFRYKGIFHARAGKTDLALTNYERALAIDPENVKTYLNRASLYLKTGQTAKACADYQKACDLGQCAELNQAKAKGSCR